MSRFVVAGRWAAAVPVFALLLATTAIAAGPVLWTQAGRDLGGGKADGVSITGDGAAVLAPPLLAMDADAPRIWSMVAGPTEVFYGAGEDGRVWRQPLAGGERQLVFDRGDRSAQALAISSDGTLFVAYGPDASIYRFERGQADAAAQPWVQLQQRYVWAMTVDAEGRLLVGTGDDGRILRVDAAGNVETVYDTPEPHVTALAAGDDGTVFAGTEGSAYVYRVAPDGDVMVLLDAPHAEITGLWWWRDELWVAAAGAEAAGAPASNEEAGVTVRVAGNGTGNGEARGGAVYRIDVGGLVDEMWKGGEQAPYAVTGTERGIVIGTGPQARLLQLGEAPGGESLLADLQDGQVVALAGGNLLIAAIANPGRVVVLGSGHRTSGTLQSSVRDAGATSTWGMLRWAADAPAGTTVRMRTRSGNSGVPDDTWSEWSEPLVDAGDSRIASPPARFLQWQAELSSADTARTPRLRRVDVAYVTRNRRPQIDKLTVHPTGVVYRDSAGFEDGLPFAQLPASIARQLRDSGSDAAAASNGGRAFLGRAYFVAGLRTVSWEASDPDSDALAFDLQLRPEAGESAWMTLASGVTSASQVIDTGKLPEGTYEVRLQASDAPSWPRAEALRSERSVAGILVDNTAPEPVGFSGARDAGGARVRGRFSDRSSLISDLQYSLDGGDWVTIGAADGAIDSPSEEVDIELAALDDGPHVVMVRGADSALNEATVRIEIPRRSE